ARDPATPAMAPASLATDQGLVAPMATVTVSAAVAGSFRAAGMAAQAPGSARAAVRVTAPAVTVPAAMAPGAAPGSALPDQVVVAVVPLKDRGDPAGSRRRLAKAPLRCAARALPLAQPAAARPGAHRW